MKIVTYNFLKGGKKGQQNQWAKIFNDFNPDIVLAQEVRHPKLDVPELYQNNQGRFVWHPVNDQWGSALFIPFVKEDKIKPLYLPGYQGWVVGAEISESNWLKRPLRVFSVHAPTKKGSSYLKEMNLILGEIAKLPGDADLIIGGDFNITVGIWHPSQRKDGNSKDSQKLLTRLRTEFGLMSSWQAANPNRNLPQTLRWGSDKTVVYHCDGIFVPAAWYQYLDSCEVVSQGWETLSDHNPVVATFNLYTPSRHQV